MFKKVLFLCLLSSVAYAEVPLLPNPTLTPGTINPQATAAVICKPGYTAGVDAQGNKVRDVSAATKKRVFKNYNLDAKSGNFEVDHLISLQLGGSNDVGNLWPQSYVSQPYNARMKDNLENVLHDLICAKKLDLKTAQKEIATNWINAYNKYVKK